MAPATGSRNDLPASASSTALFYGMKMTFETRTVGGEAAVTAISREAVAMARILVCQREVSR
jgi:hypothetical protein